MKASKENDMNENIKFGLLFALERDLESYLKFAKERPAGWLESDDSAAWLEDAANLVAALDWLLAEKVGYYLNMGYVRRDLELLREKLS